MQDLRIFVISLADDNPRRGQIGARLTELGLRFELVDAVDGRRGLSDADAAEIDREASVKIAQRQLLDGEFAAALSHRRVYERFLASDVQWALVFEDDAILDDRLVRFVESGGYRAAPLLLLHHLNARVLGEGAIVAGCESKAFELAVSPFRAAAYTLNRSVATKLVAAQTPVRNIADWPLDISQVGARALVPEIVGHPVVNEANSALEASRIKKRVRSFWDLVNLAYIRRKWRKLRAKKVS